MCGYEESYPSHLRQYKKSIREGKKYPCGICPYQATDPNSLKQHKKSMHDDIKYECNMCGSLSDQIRMRCMRIPGNTTGKSENP